MTYIEGFVTAVPTANRDAYIEHALSAAPLFRQLGAERMVECWGDDVPHGKTTDFYGAVKAKDDEAVLFSWIEYPDKRTRDAANARLQNEPDLTRQMAEMPFDGKRMIFAGFEPIVEKGHHEEAGYVQGFVIPVPRGRREEYRAFADRAAEVLKEYGATRVIEAWGDDLSHGKTTDYYRAVKAKDDESVVYSFVEWPSKAACDAATPKFMEDERVRSEDGKMPFDGHRMIYGGFRPIVDQ